MELRLESFVQDTIKRKLDLYHVVVRQHGEIIGKFDWRENRREDIHSVSKSFLSIAIGIAIDEGILRLDEKPAEIFSDKLPESPSENLQAMTIRDMIMMATGHDHFILQGYSASDDRPVRDAIENDDWVQYALEFDVPYKPGTYWKYNNFGPYLASVIIQERTRGTSCGLVKAPSVHSPRHTQSSVAGICKRIYSGMRRASSFHRRIIQIWAALS